MAVAIVLSVAPAVHSNYRSSGVPVIADSISFNLWVGLEDTARRDFDDSIVGLAYQDFQASGESFSERNKATWKRVFNHLAERNPSDVLFSQLGRQYFRLFDKDSFLTVQLPGGAAEAEGCGYRQQVPAVSTVVQSVSYGLYALLMMTVPLGFTVLKARDSKWMRVILLYFAYNLIIFLLVHVKSRYRIQFLPVFFVASGCAADWVLSRLQGESVELPTAKRWVIAGAATALSLFLAFAGSWL